MMQIPEIACTRKTGRVQSIETASAVVLNNPLKVQRRSGNMWGTSWPRLQPGEQWMGRQQKKSGRRIAEPGQFQQRLCRWWHYGMPRLTAHRTVLRIQVM
jgi:hypothetical protein